MVLPSPYRSATKKRILNDLFFTNIIFFLLFFVTGHANAQVATQPGYSLVGTIQSGDFSGAVIIVAKGEQSFFRLFDKLPDGSQIIDVRTNSIELRGADGLTFEMYVLHETKNIAAIPFSPDDPFAGMTRKPPSEQPLTPYERRRQARLGKKALDDE